MTVVIVQESTFANVKTKEVEQMRNETHCFPPFSAVLVGNPNACLIAEDLLTLDQSHKQLTMINHKL